jgi:hypothetical protein
MAGKTKVEKIRDVLVNRGYDQYPDDPEIFEELIEDIKQIVSPTRD